MNDHYSGEAPTNLDMLISLLQKTGTTETHTSVHAMSVRIPTIEYATIQALARHSGHSQNKIFCQLLAVALEEVWAGLDEKNGEAIGKIRSEILQELIGEGRLQQAEAEEC